MTEAKPPTTSAIPASQPPAGRLVRVLGGVALVALAFGLGALSQRGLSDKPAPKAVPSGAPNARPAAPPKPAPVVQPVAVIAEAKPDATTVTLSGSVADEYGRALPDAVVFAGRDIPEAQAAQKSPAVGELGVIPGPVPAIPVDKPLSAPANASSVRSDQDGKFSIGGLPSGALQVFVSLAGYEPSLLGLEGLLPGETRDDLLIVLRTPLEAKLVDQLAAEQALAADPELARISGSVLDVLGRGVPNALVQTDEGEASTRTDANGAFTLLGVSPGVLRLIAEDEHAGRAQSQEVRARKGETLPGVLLHLPARAIPSATTQAPATPAQPQTSMGQPVAAAPKPRTPQPSAPSPVLTGGFALEARPNGLFVNLIDKDSAPGRAGIEVGDLVLTIDDEPVLSVSQARGMLRDPAGETAKVRIQRGKKKLTLRWKRPGLRYAPGTAR